MSNAQQNFAHEASVVVAPKAAAQAINQGDILKVAANLVVPCDTPATDIPFGIAGQTSPVASLGDELTSMSVIREGVVFLFLKAADVAAFDDKVYLTADPQVVTVTQPGAGVAVGRCRELASVTGAAGDVTRILVEINASANS